MTDHCPHDCWMWWRVHIVIANQFGLGFVFIPLYGGFLGFNLGPIVLSVHFGDLG